jgi:hypothetical protein
MRLKTKSALNAPEKKLRRARSTADGASESEESDFVPGRMPTFLLAKRCVTDVLKEIEIGTVRILPSESWEAIRFEINE